MLIDMHEWYSHVKFNFAHRAGDDVFHLLPPIK
nr:MAG TPA: hypothetical protein [Caudoviricetes sp.]